MSSGVLSMNHRESTSVFERLSSCPSKDKTIITWDCKLRGRLCVVKMHPQRSLPMVFFFSPHLRSTWVSWEDRFVWENRVEKQKENLLEIESLFLSICPSHNQHLSADRISLRGYTRLPDESPSSEEVCLSPPTDLTWKTRSRLLFQIF